MKGRKAPAVAAAGAVPGLEWRARRDPGGLTGAKHEPRSALCQRFRNHFIQSPHGCWLWTGSLNWGGYGIFNLENKQRGAHRISWILHRGPIPAGAFVLHRCDVRNCVNPEHLFLGTQRDNMRDMVNKGRARGTYEKGERSRRAKLTDAQVAQVRSDTGSQKALAQRLGVSEQLISDLKLMKRRVG